MPMKNSDEYMDLSLNLVYTEKKRGERDIEKQKDFITEIPIFVFMKNYRIGAGKEIGSSS